jgi:signal transduction histidine kinase
VRPRRLVAQLRRFGPAIALTLIVLFTGVSAWQWWVVAGHLRAQARETSRLYARVTAALADPSPDAGPAALLAIVPDITASGIPLVITDADGAVTLAANLPIRADSLDDPRVRRYVADLDDAHPPTDVPGVGSLHHGALPVAGQLNRLAVFQAGVLLAAVLASIWAYRIAVNRDRDRLWVAMARESAHQLGTPLMSAEAWVDRLADGTSAPGEIAQHLRDDLERLDRVARRFERIGRPMRRDRVPLGAIAERVASYFRPRLPKHANAIVLTVDAPTAGPYLRGDAVLIEWALESLVRNALDALSGRGGEIQVTVEETEKLAVVRVEDDGPGIPPEVRSTLFEPGVTTKTGGWGIGLALAHRIFEEVHGGRLHLEPSPSGAMFVAEMPRIREADASA